MHISYVLNFSQAIDRSLLDGEIHEKNVWNEVIINKKAKEILGDSELHFNLSYQKEFSDNVVETIDIDEKLHVLGVAKELDFLEVPKIYFNYEN